MKAPLVTTALALGALGATAFPTPYIYDREAIAAGQIWRLATGHLSHFGAAHLLYNLLLIVPAGVILERLTPRAYRALLASTLILIGAALYLADPHLLYFGGLSAIACSLLVFLGGVWCRDPQTRFAGSGLLLLTISKVLLFDLPLVLAPLPTDPGTIVPVATAHLFGLALGGLALIVRAGRVAGGAFVSRSNARESNRALPPIVLG